ncbi:MAG TPA: DUF4349 domain-containing protein [Polyangiaceae bacterium]|nr:DUF4349 domain-containing protein [Polyangiaceae bacterium]
MRHTCALFSALALSACASQQPRSPASLPDAVQARSLAADERGPAGSVDFADQQARGEVVALESRPAPTVASTFGFGGAGSSAASSSPTAQLPPASDASAERGEMIDIQARFAVQCDAVAACATKFRDLVAKTGGRITVDEANAGKETEVTFEARVPADRFEPFAEGIVGIGAVQAREVRRRDVSKEYHDSELLLHERDTARERYEDLLKNAKTVEDTLKVEQQLERLRNEIDRIKGDLLWLKDRVASATVRVRFFPSATSEDAVFAPTATLYPTLRASMLFDLRSETQRNGYVGGGFSVQFKPFARAITLDVDIVRAALADKPTSSDWAYTFLAGFDLYSDLLGGGRRKFLNPYLGFRMGYAITEGEGDFAFGGVVGLDVVKTKAILLDLGVRVLGMVGNDQGPHVAVGPSAGFSFAF